MPSIINEMLRISHWTKQTQISEEEYYRMKSERNGIGIADSIGPLGHSKNFNLEWESY